MGDRLARSHTVIAPDLPGHAGSGDSRADLPTTAELVAETVRGAVGGERCDLLGYSLGARVALHVVTQTDLDVARVVLIGATAGIEDAEERARRRRSDDAIADSLAASGDVETFLRHWLSGPLFARLSDAADWEERLRNSAAGLAASLRLSGTGTQAPLWDRLPALSQPVLALAGNDDIRFATHALRVANLVPEGVASLIPGGGHAVHLAQPELTGHVVSRWLAASSG